MARALAFFVDNDMTIRLDKLQSSTMASGTYLTASTGVTCTIWKDLSTASTVYIAVASQNMPYSTASDSTGSYSVVIQSTEHGMSPGIVGFAHIKLEHGDIDGAWRPEFRVEYRRRN